MKKIDYSWLLAICVSIFVITTAILIVIHSRFIYQISIHFMDELKYADLSAPILMKNYNQLMDYLLPWNTFPLVIEGIKMSRGGVIHFEEVKNIFNMIYMIWVVNTILMGILGFHSIKQRDYRFIRRAIIITLIIPLILVLAIAIDFNQTFIIFHKIFFRNGLWIFDPSTDPIINYLPETFFMVMAIAIILVVFIQLFVLFIWNKKIHTNNEQ